jgi:homogentisate 1,2-dioxygenase
LPHYQRHGDLPPKHFVSLRSPGGKRYHEEILTSLGFSTETSLLYRLRAPTAMVAMEELPGADFKAEESIGLNNLLFQMSQLKREGDYVRSRIPLFFNEDITFSVGTPDRRMPGFYRNGWVDELVLVLEGTGELRSSFGAIRYRPLDFLHIPRSVTVRWAHDDGPHRLIVVESANPIVIPSRYLNPAGQLRENAPFHERDLRAPSFEAPVDEVGEFPIVIKTGERLFQMTLDHHPFDAVGWDGCFYPFALNMADLEPISGRTDRLPDQYQVFDTEGAYFVAITPKRSPDHPDAAPAQPHHMNIDYDEIMLRIAASNRPGDPGAGTVTLHPRGLSHGPRHGFIDKPRLEIEPLWALMVDTRKRLRPTTESMVAIDWSNDNVWRDSSPGS